MSMVAIIPVADLISANAALAAQGFGPANFSVPAYAEPRSTHGAFHSWSNPALEAAVQVIANTVVEISDGDPITRVQLLIASQGAKWGDKAPLLPSSGTVTAGDLYRFDDLLWSVIQTFSRTTYSAHPSTYPALIRTVHEPGVIAPWKQPIDQYDAYKLVNPFNGQPDQCTHNGQTWTVSAADGSGNNVWEPGVFGWTYPGYVAPPVATWVDTGATIIAQAGTAYQLSATLTGLSINQPLRLGPTVETKFNGYWPTVGTPSAYILTNPFQQVAVGLKVWKLA